MSSPVDFGAVVLDALDEDALGVLARRLAPYLERVQQQKRPRVRAAYTVATLADELNLSEKSIRRAIRHGDLRAVKRAERWIISAEAVDQWATAPEANGRRRHSRVGASAARAAGPSLRSVLCGANEAVNRREAR